MENTCLWSIMQCAFCDHCFPKLEKKVSLMYVLGTMHCACWLCRKGMDCACRGVNFACRFIFRITHVDPFFSCLKIPRLLTAFLMFKFQLLDEETTNYQQRQSANRTPFSFVFVFMQSHNDACLRFPVECSNKCGLKNIPREEVQFPCIVFSWTDQGQALDITGRVGFALIDKSPSFFFPIT